MNSNEKFRNTRNELCNWTEAVFSNEDTFIDKFISCPKKNIMDILNVWWNEYQMMFYYVTEEGAHITDTANIKYWFEFLDTVQPRTMRDIPDGKYVGVWHLDQIQILHGGVGYNFVTSPSETTSFEECIVEVKNGLMQWFKVT